MNKIDPFRLRHLPRPSQGKGSQRAAIWNLSPALRGKVAAAERGQPLGDRASHLGRLAAKLQQAGEHGIHPSVSPPHQRASHR